MARLLTYDFENRDLVADGFQTVVAWQKQPPCSPDVAHSGKFSLKCDLANEWVSKAVYANDTQGQLYTRTFLYISAELSGTLNFIINYNNHFLEDMCTIMLDFDNTLRLYDTFNFVQKGSASAALDLNTWYCIELLCDSTNWSSVSLEARLNGASFASGSAINWSGEPGVGIRDVEVGRIAGTSTGLLYFDDLAVNDDTTGSNNTWIGLDAPSQNVQGVRIWP